MFFWTNHKIAEPREPRIRPPEGDRIPLTNATLVKVTVGSEVTVLTQSQINITCVVSGIPKPNITWLRDGERLEAEEGSFLVLNIQDVNDAGRITCQAENMAGKAALSTIINVIGREKKKKFQIQSLNKFSLLFRLFASLITMISRQFVWKVFSLQTVNLLRISGRLRKEKLQGCPSTFQNFPRVSTRQYKYDMRDPTQI